MNNQPLKKMLFSIFALLAISSCGTSDKDSLTNICRENPELCSDLHKANDCRYKRTSLIRARYYDKIEPTEKHTIALLDELSDYQACLELTMLMQTAPDTGRKQKSVENYFTAQQLMKSTLKEIKNTQDPHIAYYLWTRFQDSEAKKVFLNTASKQETKDPALLIKLATLYTKKYPQYSLDLFYKALRESKSLEAIPQNTFTFMLTIFYQNKSFEQAYIWASIAKKANDQAALPINFDLILQKGLINGKKRITNEDALQETADTYYTALAEGKFKLQAPKLPL